MTIRANQSAIGHEVRDVCSGQCPSENVERGQQFLTIVRCQYGLEERLDRPQAFVQFHHNEEQVDQ